MAWGSGRLRHPAFERIGKAMSDVDKAKELLVTITKSRLSGVLDESVIAALQLLLRDYVERARLTEPLMAPRD
jgi:hypothetical protein